jgi:hypothetical protein
VRISSPCSAISSLSSWRSETIEITAPFTTTGRCRQPVRCIFSRHASTVSSGSAVTTSRVITWPIGVCSGSSPATTTRVIRSRSEKIPTSWPRSSTGTAPTPASVMVTATRWTGSSGPA